VTPSPKPAERCAALDALRGFVMLALAWGLLAREGLLKAPGLHWLAAQLHHVQWEGMVFWDLIQPAFWMAAGAAMPFALARRVEQGFTFRQNLRHALLRVFKLVLCGQILIGLALGRPMFHPRETLTQFAACYLICFLVLHLKLRGQAMAAAALMALNWGLYLLFPGAAGPFSPADNVGVAIDRAVFGMNTAGRWVSIYCIGSSVTMLFGCWTGSLLLGARPAREKLRILALAAAGCLASGVILGFVEPVMQKTWTAAYTFYTAAWVLLAVLLLFWSLDLKGHRGAALPLTVVGANAIFFYAISQALGGWVDKSLAIFTARFSFAGAPAPTLQAAAAVAVMWYPCYWLYRRRIFFRF
jgi:predicted acyltransferase